MPTGPWEVQSLQSMLFGEHMAIDTYEQFVSHVSDQDTRATLVEILQDHKALATRLSARILSLGAIPQEGRGAAGAITSVIERATLPFKDDLSILKKAYDGEDKGISMGESAIAGNLDADGLALVKETLAADHDHLKMLKAAIEHHSPRRLH